MGRQLIPDSGNENNIWNQTILNDVDEEEENEEDWVDVDEDFLSEESDEFDIEHDSDEYQDEED